MVSKYYSKVVIGTWSLSGDFGRVHKRQVYKSIETAIKNNFLEFDTAPTYGNQNKMQNILSEIVRNEKNIKINTKCGYNSDSIKTFKDVDIINSIDLSLKQFGKINTLFLHNPRKEIKNWPKIISILKEYQKRKHIKYIGISLAKDFYFEKKIMNQFDYLQDELNLLRPLNIDYLRTLKPMIMARSPLASGCLTGKLKVDSKFSKNDHRSGWLKKKRLKNIVFQVNEIKKITGVKLKDFSKIYLLQNRNIDKVIFGIKKDDHVTELVKSINDSNILSKEKIKKISQLAESNFNLDIDNIGY